MASKFHPIYSGVWKDPHLEGASFECKGFFAWLFSNDAVRPSGIYRVTDAQAAAETELPLGRVRAHFQDLAARGRIVRDVAWVFVKGYLKRQPNHVNLLKAARLDVDACTSVAVLTAFSEKYPLHHQWSADRLATIGQPLNETRPSEQCSAVALQSIAEQSSTTLRNSRSAVAAASPGPPGLAAPLSNGFALWPEITQTLDGCPTLGSVLPLRDAQWWLAELDANPLVDLVGQLRKAEAWIRSNPSRAPRKHIARFLHAWFARAEREE